MIGGWLPGEGRRTDRIGALLMGSTRTASCAMRAASAPASPRRRSTTSAGASRRCGATRARSTWRAPKLPARGGVRRAAAGGRDRVPRVDGRAGDARALVQGAARGQAGDRGRASRHGRRRAPAGRAADPDSPEALFDEVERLPEGALAVITEGRRLKLTNWDKVLYPGDRLHQGRPDRVLRAGRAGRAPAPARPAADAQALSERRRRAVLLREAVALAPPRMGADGAHRRRQLHARAGPADAGLAGQPRRRRAAHLAGAGGERRSGRR